MSQAFYGWFLTFINHIKIMINGWNSDVSLKSIFVTSTECTSEMEGISYMAFVRHRHINLWTFYDITVNVTQNELIQMEAGMLIIMFLYCAHQEKCFPSNKDVRILLASPHWFDIIPVGKLPIVFYLCLEWFNSSTWVLTNSTQWHSPWRQFCLPGITE